MSAEPFFLEELGNLRRAGRLRRLLDLRGGGARPVVDIGRRRVLLLCSNNYLGLADDERIKSAAKEAIEAYGTGATGSRLISGNSDLCDALESDLAAFKRTESALVFSSGYQANIGAISSLAGPKDAIFSDELNHASIIDGCRLSRANVHVYRHRDTGHLAELLGRHADAGRKLIVTESVFSMDGDIAPLREISALSEEYSAVLMVDEAHGTGVMGKRGAGVVEALGLGAKVDVQMGTFSKALGSLGGYVAGNKDLISFLVNRARSFIFTTGLPPAVLAASRAAVKVVQIETWRREMLVRHASKLRDRLREMGFALGPSESQIIPVMIGNERRAMAACRWLLRQGMFVQGIRPPTVPSGTARLRLSPMATHSAEQIEAALDAFEKLADLLKRRKKVLQ